jgi:hypothetical protein
MSDEYEKWKKENPPRPDNEWERFADRVKDYKKVEDKNKKG